MKYKVSNPTRQEKVVRAAGGPLSISPQTTVEADPVEWDADYLARLRSAGLLVEQVKAKPAPAPTGGPPKKEG